MSLHETVSGERVHISFFGLRNAGKSSLINAVTGQSLSVVSDTPGTTTDPVKKAMELLPLGPVLLTDTPGLDDVGELGGLRVQKAFETLSRTDIAVLVTDAAEPLTDLETQLLGRFREKGLPHLIALNKADTLAARPAPPENGIYVSALTGENVQAFKERLAALAPKTPQKYLIADLLVPGRPVLLVVPIDAAAPKGRLILPQQQTLRELLDAHIPTLVCQPRELSGTLALLNTPPQLVITDSQVFGAVDRDVPPDIPLTSFSILFARYKGELSALRAGAEKLGSLKDADRVLIAEGCSHHRQCGDIGTEKMPAWIKNASGASPAFEFCSGGEFPADLSRYALIVHCGGCMLNETEMKSRMRRAEEAGVPIVNYGVAIAEMHGILPRSTAFFDRDQGGGPAEHIPRFH